MRALLGATTLAAFVVAAPCAWAQAGTIKEIEVRGNSRIARDTILIQMRTKVGQPYVQSNLQADEDALYDTGFFSTVNVTATPLENEEWKVTVDVAEYPEIREIRIVGNTAVPTDDILKVLEVKPGELFNLKSAKPSAEAIQRLYAARGFFARIARFEPSRESPGTIEIEIVEGVVGSVTITGNTATQRRVVERLVKTRPGEPFSFLKWQRDLSRLVNTRYFETVENAGPEEPRDGYKIDLVGKVREARTGVFNVGVAVDPRNSYAGLLSIADTNFRGTGQSISLNYTQATTGGGASTSIAYTNPFIDNQDTTLRFELYSRLNFRFANTGLGSGNNSPTSNDRYTERRTGGSLGLQRPRGDFDSYGISGRFESITTGDLSDNADDNYIRQDGDVAAVAFTAISNHRDVDVDPSRGYFARLDLEPGFSNISDIGGLANADNTILGRTFFTKATFDTRYYISRDKGRRKILTEPRRVLATRVTGGAIASAGTVPFFEQYFVGGADTIRGYQEDRFWGNNFILATAEYRQPIPGQSAFSVIGFVDYGGAWGGFGSVNDFTQSSSLRLHLGYGAGIRLRTPVGPIKLDYGFAGDGGSRAHFSIGTSF